MGKTRKLTAEQIESAAIDRHNGVSWHKLREKYGCSINRCGII